jgi:hypothetical protein
MASTLAKPRRDRQGARGSQRDDPLPTRDDFEKPEEKALEQELERMF